MKTKHLLPAAIALVVAVMSPGAAAQDEDKPEEKKSRAAKLDENPTRSAPDRSAPKDQPGRGERRDEHRADARKPEKKRDGERPHESHPHKKEMRTFLGVATSPVHPALREHLDLDDGFGIQVEQVLDNSPAGKAGLKKSDILILLDDQRLTGPEHLSLLVRSMASGDKISLTLIRKGKEQKIDLELGEKAESEFGPIGRGPIPTEPWRESMERNQDYWRKWMERGRDGGPTPHERHGRAEHPSGPEDRDAASRLPEGRPPAVSVRPGFPVHVFGSKGMIQIDNEEGELTISEKDGENLIVIKDKEGNTIHEGEFDPEQGVGGLPEKARDHLKKMKMEDLEVLFRSRPPNESTEETSAPKLPGSGGQPL